MKRYIKATTKVSSLKQIPNSILYALNFIDIDCPWDNIYGVLDGNTLILYYEGVNRFIVFKNNSKYIDTLLQTISEDDNGEAYLEFFKSIEQNTADVAYLEDALYV